MGWCYLFKRDVPQAKAMVAKAKDAGRTDSRLAESVEKFETAMAKGKDGLRAGAQGRGAAARAHRADGEHRRRRPKPQGGQPPTSRPHALPSCPTVTAPATLIYLLSADQDYGVREAAAVALGEHG